jgi:O-antigen ligase
MFLSMMIDAIPGLGLAIAPGLSAKNLYLYSLCVFIAARAVLSPAGLRFVDLHVHIPFLLLIAYATFTLALSSVFTPTYDEFQGLKSLKNKLVDLYLFMFVFRYLVVAREDYVWLLRTIVVLMFLASFVTLIDFLNVPDLGIVGTHKGRIEGPIGSANQYGALLAFLLPISIATMPAAGDKGRWIWYFGIMVTAVLLIGTGSRGAYFSTVAGSAIAVYLLRDQLDLRKVLRMGMISAGVVTALFAAYAALNPDFVMVLIEKSTTGDLETASSGRWAIWGAAFGVMLESPISFLVGYGWNTFETSGIWKSAHSEYVNRFFELGIVGLAIFVTLILSIIFRARRVLRTPNFSAPKLLTGFVVAMCILTVDIAFVMPFNAWTTIWITVGLMLGIQATEPQVTPTTRKPNFGRTA